MNALDQELQKINASTVRMLSQVRESVNLAQRGLVEADVKSAQKCIDDDVHIDTASCTRSCDPLVTFN